MQEVQEAYKYHLELMADSEQEPLSWAEFVKAWSYAKVDNFTTSLVEAED